MLSVVQAELGYGAAAGEGAGLVGEVEQVHDERAFLRQDVEVNLLAETVKLAALVKAFELAVTPHSLLLGLNYRWFRAGAAYPQMAAGRSIPPQDHAAFVVLAQVDVQIEGNVAAHVVVVEGAGTRLLQVRQRIPRSEEHTSE